MPFAPTGKYISPKQRIYCYLTSRKVPCAGRDFFDRSSLLAHDTPYEVVFSIVARCRPDRQHIKFPPNVKTTLERFQGMAMRPTKTSFFLFGGLGFNMNRKTEPINCDFSQVYRLCVLASGTNYRH